MTVHDFNSKQPKKGNLSKKGQAQPKSTELNFDEVKQLAAPHLEDILCSLSPEGDLQGKEYRMLNPRRREDGNLGSFKFNIETGKWADFAAEDAAGGDIVSLVAYMREETQTKAAQWIMAFVAELPKASETGLWKTIGKASKKDQAKDLGKEILPIPASAGDPPASHPTMGVPDSIHFYGDAEGNGMCFIYRYEAKPPGRGTKVFLPLTFRRYIDGTQRWDWKGIENNRPLYNLAELISRPDAAVVLVEGEKSADAAKVLFPDRVVVATMNGSLSPHKSNLKPLAGRDVLIWPDNDGPGAEFTARLIELLKEQDSESVVAVMKPIRVKPAVDEHGQPALNPGFTPGPGWDAADAVEQGWTAEHIELLGPEAFISAGTIRRTEPMEVTRSQASLTMNMPDYLAEFLGSRFVNGLIYTNQSFFGYRSGFWRQLDDWADIRNSIARFQGKDATAKKIEAMAKLLQAFLAVNEAHFVPDRKLVCVKNGSLNTETYLLEPHSPDHGLTNQIAIEWDSTATCPTWLRFLDDIFALDSDKSEKIAFLQQWFGYCMTTDMTQHKFVWMVGAGGNGKSVLLQVLEQLIGPENVGNAQIERFESGAVRAVLEGKLLNISSEMSANATVSDSYLKQITGGDPIDAERKFKAPHKFKPYVRLIASTNNLPRLLDTSEGFARRAVILRFNRIFSESEKDPALVGRLLSELPGIAVWAIEGLKNLRRTGKLAIPSSSDVELARYRTDSDPVALFAEECLRKSESRGPTPSELFEIFNTWSQQARFSSMNKVTFGRRLAGLGFGKSRSAGQDYWNVAVDIQDWPKPYPGSEVAVTAQPQIEFGTPSKHKIKV